MERKKCLNCHEPAVAGRARCEQHLERVRESMKLLGAKRRALGLCKICGRASGGPTRCPSCAAKDADYNRRLKAAALAAYGGATCACCGEAEIAFLTIDHVGGGGHRHRKSITMTFYQWLRKNDYPPGFRVLCMNCNAARGMYGYCPHECGSQLAQAVTRKPDAGATSAST